MRHIVALSRAGLTRYMTGRRWPPSRAKQRSGSQSEYNNDGRLDDVTDSTLTIRIPPDMHPRTISRGLVVRVAVLTKKKMRWDRLAGPLAVAVIGGFVGALVGAAMTNAKVAAISLGVFTASLIGAYHVTLGRPRMARRLRAPMKRPAARVSVAALGGCAVVHGTSSPSFASSPPSRHFGDSVR